MANVCRKCQGEDFRHHATFCPERDHDKKEGQLPFAKPVDFSITNTCSYCGHIVTLREYLESHTDNQCTREERLAFQADGEEFLQEDFDR